MIKLDFLLSCKLYIIKWNKTKKYMLGIRCLKYNWYIQNITYLWKQKYKLWKIFQNINDLMNIKGKYTGNSTVNWNSSKTRNIWKKSGWREKVWNSKENNKVSLSWCSKNLKFIMIVRNFISISRNQTLLLYCRLSYV